MAEFFKVRCPRCGAYTGKATEAEALADCPERDYEAEDREAEQRRAEGDGD